MTKEQRDDAIKGEGTPGGTARWQATCNECGATFTDRESFRKHARDRHGAGKKYKCPYCRQGFDTSDDLDFHAKHCCPNT
jgi:DNA-directed RNA polymerase subunit RPC12/RpoP